LQDRRRAGATSDWEPSASLATWAGFALMCLGMFMDILDVQVVATSLPTIWRALAVPAD
jgi:DHA2 family multidrug resistance protein